MQADARGCKRVTEQADGHSIHWLDAFMAVSLRRKAASRMEVPYEADDDALLFLPSFFKYFGFRVCCTRAKLI